MVLLNGFERAIAQVLAGSKSKEPEGKTVGTAFLVSDELLLTCAHVVEAAGYGPGDFIPIRFANTTKLRAALVVQDGFSEPKDVAVLALDGKPPADIRPLPLWGGQAPGWSDFRSYGYPLGFPDSGKLAEGRILGVDAYGRLQLRSSEIDKGNSGGPVIDTTLRHVVGMIHGVAPQDPERKNPDAAFAIPVSTLVNVYGKLPVRVPGTVKEKILSTIWSVSPTGAQCVEEVFDHYLGSPDAPSLFGGRIDSLVGLDTWLEDPNAPARALLVAPGARGKSALIAHWLYALDPDRTQFIYLPVSQSFGSGEREVAFPIFAAQVMTAYGWPYRQDRESREWGNACIGLLRNPPTDRRKLLIIVDGLDEAGDWGEGPYPFPTKLPNGVKMIVSARELAGEVGLEGWRKRLKWQNFDVFPVELPLLDRVGIEEIVKSTGLLPEDGDPLDDFVDRVMQLSEGEPLLVELWIQHLADRHTSLEQSEKLTATQLLEIMSGNRPGLDGFFKQWWDDQFDLWGGDTPMLKKGITTVLSLMAVAHGPLREEDFLALREDKDELSSNVLTKVVPRDLKRIIRGDGNGRGYSFTHPALREYEYEQLGHDVEEWEQRFLKYGLQQSQSMAEGSLTTDQTSLYLLKYHGAFVRRMISNGIPEYLKDPHVYALISRDWLHAQQQRLGEVATSVRDIHLALDYAQLRDDIVAVLKCAAAFRDMYAASSFTKPIYRAVDKGDFAAALDRATVYRQHADWTLVMVLYLAWEASLREEFSVSRQAIQKALRRKPFAGFCVLCQALLAAIVRQVKDSDPLLIEVVSECVENPSVTEFIDSFRLAENNAPSKEIINEVRLKIDTLREAARKASTAFISSLEFLLDDEERAYEIADLSQKLASVADTDDGREALRDLVILTKGNPYVEYRDIALKSLGAIIVLWAEESFTRELLRDIIQTGLDQEGVTHTLDLPQILQAGCEKLNVEVPEKLKTYCSGWSEDRYESLARLEMARSLAAYYTKIPKGIEPIHLLDLAKASHRGYAGFASILLLALHSRYRLLKSVSDVKLKDLLVEAMDQAEAVRDTGMRLNRMKLVKSYRDQWLHDDTITFEEAERRLDEMYDRASQLTYKDFLISMWAKQNNEAANNALERLVPLTLMDATQLSFVLAHLIGQRLEKLRPVDLERAVELCMKSLVTQKQEVVYMTILSPK